MFWLAVTIFLDPGGYIITYVQRSMIGGLQITDVGIVMLTLPLISPKINIRSYFNYPDNKWIFYFLLIYAIVYHVIVFGFIAPGNNFKSLLHLLQYERLTIWGFIAIIPGYIFFRRSYHLMIRFAFITSILLVALYMIRQFTGLPVIPLRIAERGIGTNALRIGMISYGYAYWFIYISLMLLIYKLELPWKNWIYIIGLVVAVAQILSLTRRSTLSLLYSFFLIYFFYTRIINLNIISFRITRVFISIGVLILILYLFAPDYIRYTRDIMENTLNVINLGHEDMDYTDARLTRDIPGHLALFRQSPIIGYGYDALWYSNDVGEGGLSANDVPLTAALGMFGILGLSLYSIYYIKTFKILYQSYNVLKAHYWNRFAGQNVIIFCILMALFIAYISRYTLNFMAYFLDLIDGKTRVISMLSWGVLLASRDILAQELSFLKQLKINE